MSQFQNGDDAQGEGAEQVASANEIEENTFDVESDSDEEPELDETEAELERLVFGDSAGFREALKQFGQEEQDGGLEAEQVTGLEGLDDADVGQALAGRA